MNELEKVLLSLKKAIKIVIELLIVALIRKHSGERERERERERENQNLKLCKSLIKINTQFSIQS